MLEHVQPSLIARGGDNMQGTTKKWRDWSHFCWSHWQISIYIIKFCCVPKWLIRQGMKQAIQSYKNHDRNEKLFVNAFDWQNMVYLNIFFTSVLKGTVKSS